MLRGTVRAESVSMTLDSMPGPSHGGPEHDPDGVPHDIVFRSVLAACVLASTCLVMLDIAGWLGGALVGLIAIPIMTVSLGRRAEREREEEDSTSK